MQKKARHLAGAAMPETACRCRPPRNQPSQEREPALRFTPYAWSKLRYLRDRGETEVGGFGVTCRDDPLLVSDVVTVHQYCTPVSVCFDDVAVADFFDSMVDAGHRPEHCGRVWVHTHPADSAAPSETDEETFARCFGGCDWAVMAILARGGSSYARLAFHVGPGGSVEIPVRVDFAAPFPAADRDAWEREYAKHVVAVDAFAVSEVPGGDRLDALPHTGDRDAPHGDGGHDNVASVFHPFSGPDPFGARNDDPRLPDSDR